MRGYYNIVIKLLLHYTSDCEDCLKLFYMFLFRFSGRLFMLGL
jgi:hypothetical protein